MTLIQDSDYFVRYVHLPHHIGGCTCMNDDGTFDIYINADLPLEKQWHAFLHELGHILDDHFYREDLTDEEKERRAEQFFFEGVI